MLRVSLSLGGGAYGGHLAPAQPWQQGAGGLPGGGPAVPDVVPLLELLHAALLGSHAQAQGVVGRLHPAHPEVHRRALEPQVVTHALLEARGLVVGRGDWRRGGEGLQ